MPRPKVYLAGPITGLTFGEANGWREEATFKLAVEDIDALNPLRGKEHLAGVGPLPNDFDGGHEAVEQDLEDIREAEVVLANFANAREISAGTMAELGYAYAACVPVISVVPRGNPHDHIFVRHMSHSVRRGLDEAIDDVVYYLEHFWS